MKLFKRPRLTEWLFGVLLLLTPSLAGVVFYLPLQLLGGEPGKALGFVRLVIVLIAVAVLPVSVFRCSRFFVRVASRELLRQNRQIR
jgi:hypothetical protein